MDSVAIGLALLELLLKVAPGIVDALKDPSHALAPRVEEVMSGGNASRKLLEG